MSGPAAISFPNTRACGCRGHAAAVSSSQPPQQHGPHLWLLRTCGSRAVLDLPDAGSTHESGSTHAGSTHESAGLCTLSAQACAHERQVDPRGHLGSACALAAGLRGCHLLRACTVLDAAAAAAQVGHERVVRHRGRPHDDRDGRPECGGSARKVHQLRAGKLAAHMCAHRTFETPWCSPSLWCAALTQLLSPRICS